MNIISTNTYKIRFKDEGYGHLNEIVASNNYTNLYVLVDENTKKLCLRRFEDKASFKFEIIEIKSGEIHKNIDTCIDVWNHFTLNLRESESVESFKKKLIPWIKSNLKSEKLRPTVVTLCTEVKKIN